MGEQPVSSQSADAGVGQQAARWSAMSRCSRRQFRRLFGAYDRAKGHHMAIVPASGWRGSCDVPVGWTEEHQCTRNPESGAPRAELLRCHGVLTSALNVPDFNRKTVAPSRFLGIACSCWARWKARST